MGPGRWACRTLLESPMSPLLMYWIQLDHQAFAMTKKSSFATKLSGSKSWKSRLYSFSSSSREVTEENCVCSWCVRNA